MKEKRQIVVYVEKARPRSEEVLSDIQKIEDRRYGSVADVAKAAGLVRQ